MSRIFISHSSINNAEAIALRDWLVAEGWSDLFLDLDPERGIAAGERWERALVEATTRCEAVLFLVSRGWLASRWCLRELNLAHRLNKRLFGLLVEDIPISELPADLTSNWQLVRLASGRDHVVLHAELPVTHEKISVTFSAEGLARLRTGLARAGLDARFFSWPPADDPERAPYRGLKPLEAEDAGIFFGRDAPIVAALDTLRGLRDGAPPRLLVILGASGAGKSSVLRAGLLPRLARDDRNFLPLAAIRPERAVLSGETGLVRSLEMALKAHGLARSRSELKAIVNGGAAALQALLVELVEAAAAPRLSGEDAATKPPTLVLAIDQGEELFLTEGAEEAKAFLALLRALVDARAPDLIALFTIRTDSYEPLQSAQGPAEALAGVKQVTLSLPPMPQGAYAQVIEGPAARLAGTPRALKIDPALTQTLLADIEAGGAKDALPLLAFTLERLYLEHGGDGDLSLAEYQALGGVRGSIEAAVEGAFKAADANPAIPKDRQARLALLRRGLIPWLAGIDPDSGSPRRRVARLSEIPGEARPLIDLLVEARLLATDVDPDSGEATIEPAHEALLRQWGQLEGWIEEDFGALTTLEAVKRATRDWTANGGDRAWLAHTGGRLEDAERVAARSDFDRFLTADDRVYLGACRRSENARVRRSRYFGLGALAAVAVVALFGFFSLFLSIDSDLNQARSFLRDGRIEDAQQRFQRTVSSPLHRLLPASSSARSLASELLDTAFVEDILPLTAESFGGSPPDGGQLIGHRGRLVALLRSSSLSSSSSASHVLIDCRDRGKSCHALAMGRSWPNAVLLRDGDEFFVLSNDHGLKQQRIGKIVSGAGLQIEPLSGGNPAQLRRDGNDVRWIGRDHIWSSVYDDIFSHSPPATLVHPDGKRGLRLDGVAAFDAAFGENLSLSEPARCSGDLGLCVGRFTNIDEDARGTVKQFDLWGLRLTPGGSSERRWTRLVSRLFQPAPSANAAAVSRNGHRFAMTKNKLLHVWRYADISEHDRRPWKSLQLAREPFDIAFEAENDKIVVLSAAGLQRVHLEPRSTAVAAPTPDNTMAAPSDRNLSQYRIDAGRTLIEREHSVILLDRAKGTRTTLLEAGPNERPNVELLRRSDAGDPIVAIRHAGGRQSIYRFPPNRPPAKLATLGGSVLALPLDARMVLIDSGSCQLRLHDLTRSAVPIAIGVPDSNCRSVSSYQVRSYPIDKSRELLALDMPGMVLAVEIELPENRGPAKVKEHIASLQVRGSHRTRNGIHFVSEQLELVSIGVRDGAVVQSRRRLNDAQLRERMRRAIASDTLGLLATDTGAFALVLGHEGCGPGQPEGAVYESNVLLLSAEGSSLRPQFMLNCVPAFPAKLGAFDSEAVLLQGSAAEPAFLGALTFPAVFEWDRKSPSLQLHAFADHVEASQPRKVRSVALELARPGGGEGSHAYMDVRAKDFDPEPVVPMMTYAAYSPAARLLAFFGLTGRSAGNARQLSLLDLRSMTLRRPESEAKAFFDLMRGAELSPNGRLVLSDKDLTGFELFATGDASRIALPKGVHRASFSSSSEIALALRNGAELKWAVPEGEDDALDFVRRRLSSLARKQAPIEMRDGHLMRGEGLALTGRDAEAEKSFVLALRRDPGAKERIDRIWGTVYFRRGASALQSGNDAEAERLFAQARERDPSTRKRIDGLWGEQWLQRGKEALAQNRDSEAERHFALALKRDPAVAGSIDGYWANAFVDRAASLVRKGDDEAAQKQFALAAARAPSRAGQIEETWIRELLARGRRLLGEASNDRTANRNKVVERALSTFTQAVTHATSGKVAASLTSHAIGSRGEALVAAGRFADAIRDFQEAHRIATAADREREVFRSREWYARNDWAIDLRERGNLAGALLMSMSNYLDMTPAVRKLVNPSSSRRELATLTYPIAGLFAAGTGNVAETITDCDRAASHAWDPFRVAVATYFDRLDAEKAIAACTLAIAQHPAEPRYRLNRARAFSRAADAALTARDNELARKQYSAMHADLDDAMARGYPMAFNNKGFALRHGQGVARSEQAAAALDLEAFNRVVHCCWAPVARHLLAEEAKYDRAEVRRVVRALTPWAAALGSEGARSVLAQLAADGGVDPIEVLPPAKFTDLPPWLR